MIGRSRLSHYQMLARVLLEAAGIAGAAAFAACGGDVVVDTEDGASGSGASGGGGASSSSSSTVGPGTSVSSSSGPVPFTCNDPNVTLYFCSATAASPCPQALSPEVIDYLG